MRSFSKKLAFVLAAAMVFTSFAPAAKAEAAKEMTINKSSQILYVTDGNGINDAAQVGGGKGNVSEYDFYVKNKPSDWKKTLKFEWTSSNDEVATVDKSGLTTAVAVGKATISCKITDKDGDVVTTAKTKVTVKANAADVEIKNASKISGTVLELKDGKATLDLDRVMYDANGNKATSRTKGCVTDYTEWLYEPKTGVDVNQSKGVFTFTAPGEYKLYCRTYQSSKYTKTTAESDPVVVTVVDKTFDIKQATSTKFNISFKQAATIGRGDVTVTQLVPLANGGVEKVDYKVREVKMAADKMSAEVETFFKLIHEGEYTIDVKGYESNTFTASVGEPVRVEVYAGNTVGNRQVAVGTLTNLNCRLIDAKDVDVTEEYKEDANHAKTVRYFISYDGNYDLEDNCLYFNNVGEKATVVAEYHPNNVFDGNGVEQGVVKSAETPFVAVNPDALRVVSIDSWQFVYGGQSIVLGDNRYDSTRAIDYVRVKLSDGSTQDLKFYDQEIVKDGVSLGYANFTALNADVVDVYEDNNTDANGNLTGNVNVYGRQVGTASIMVSYVTNMNGEYVEVPLGAISVKVDPKRVMNSVEYRWSKNMTVSASPADNANTKDVEDMEINLYVADQYGKAYSNYIVLDWEPTNKLAERATKAEAFDNVASTKIDESVEMSHDIAVTIAADQEKITIHNAQLQALLWDTDNNLKADATQPAGSTSFGYRVRVKDLATGKILTATFSINARGHLGDVDHDDNRGHAISINMDKGALNATNGNIVRYEDPTPWDRGNDKWDTEKILTFKVFEMCNQAKYDEVALDPLLKADVDNDQLVTGNYYFTILRNGKDVTNKALGNETIRINKTTTRPSHTVLNSWDVDGNAEKGTVVQYHVTHTDESAYQAGRDIVIYTNEEETIGAASYSFVLYQATGVDTYKRISTQSASVNLNTGKYNLTFRNSTYAKDTTNEALLQCFKIADRNGVEFSHDAPWADNVTNTRAKFGNVWRDYTVVRNYDKVAPDRAGEAVYVEKIVFWEPVAFGTKVENGNTVTDYDNPILFSEYVVPVNNFIEIVHE